MSDTTNDVQWYIAREGQQHGPLSEPEMQLFISEGYLKPTDLIWRPGFTDWTPATNIFPQTAQANERDASTAPANPAAAGTPAANTSNASPADEGKRESVPNQDSVATRNLAGRADRKPTDSDASTPAQTGLTAQKTDPAAHSGSKGGPLQTSSGQGTGTATNNALTTATNQPGSGSAANSITGGTEPTKPGTARPNEPKLHQTAPIGSLSAQPGQSTTPGASPPSAVAGKSDLHANTPRYPLGSKNPAAATSAATTQSPTNAQPNARTNQRPVKRKPPRSSAGIITALAAMVLVGGAAYSGFTYREEITDFARTLVPQTDSATNPADAPVVEARKTKSSPPAPAGQKTANATDVVPGVVLAPTNNSLAAPPSNAPAPAAPNGQNVTIASLDAQFQKSPLWALLKAQYPDWYEARLKQAMELASQGNNPEVTKRLLTEIITLRRKHAKSALSASTDKLLVIANAFLSNLQLLAKHSTDTCYMFISKGELSPQVLDLMADTRYGPGLETQATLIFEAIAEGRAAPVTRERATKDDYNKLAQQLGALGWKADDLKLFANPAELAKAPPARVCQMVQDWFAAHIALKDSEAQDRLLFETLRPVVAG